MFPPAAYAQYFAEGCGEGHDVPYNATACECVPHYDGSGTFFPCPPGCGSAQLPAVGGGGAIFALDSDVEIAGSTLRDNHADSYGGGVLLSHEAKCRRSYTAD